MTNNSVKRVTIKDERNEGDMRSYSKVKLQLFHERAGSILVLKTPGGADEIELYLDDCAYVEESSSGSKILSIRDDRGRRLITIIDTDQQCSDIINDVIQYLKNEKGKGGGRKQERQRSRTPPRPRSRTRSRSRSRSPQEFRTPPQQRRQVDDNSDVNELINALNGGDATIAIDIARKLARDQKPIRFALDMINESGNKAQPPPPKPVEQQIKLKLSIESFLSEDHNQTFDVAILPGTTVKDLKNIIVRDTNIGPQQQFWYIGQTHLQDDYIFGVSPPGVNEETRLILYIAKPQQG